MKQEAKNMVADLMELLSKYDFLEYSFSHRCVDGDFCPFAIWVGSRAKYTKSTRIDIYPDGYCYHYWNFGDGPQCIRRCTLDEIKKLLDERGS